MIHEFLPARHILWKRHIEPVPFCEVCGAPEESICHVLLECSIANEFWHQVRVGIGVKIPKLNPLTWALWMRRNRRRHDEHLISLQQAAAWVKDTAFDLWNLTHQLTSKGPVQEMQKCGGTQHRDGTRSTLTLLSTEWFLWCVGMCY